MNTSLATPFIKIVKNAYDYCNDISSDKAGAIGYFCTYTPVEFIHSLGFHPVRITGSSRIAEKAYSLVPNFICPYIRGALEKGMGNEYGFLTGIVQGYTCDAACGLVNIWEENIGGKVFHSLPLPYNDNSEARDFFRSRLTALKDMLVAIGGEYSEESLQRSLELYSNIRNALLDLYSMRAEGTLSLSGSEFLSTVLGSFMIAPEHYHAMVNELVSRTRDHKPQAPKGVPVFISGSIIESPGVIDIIEESGGRVVMDDLCTGYRNLVPPSEVGTDPIESLIDRYMKRFPCPARTRARVRAPEIIRLVKNCEARGFIFLFQKFCSPHLADYPILLRELTKNNIPCMAIEIEEGMISEGQTKTRIEGFIEMIEQG